jgi:hypothetical protein
MDGTHISGVMAGALSLALAGLLVACVPVDAGPPDIDDVEAHLRVQVTDLPEACVPVGLSGDGRGRFEAAGFDCGDGATLRIERFDGEFLTESVPSVPSETSPGRVEWRDDRTGDVIRVLSDELEIEALVGIAQSIDVRDRR